MAASKVGRATAVRAEKPQPESANEVRLVGRLSGEPMSRVLPSGDEITTWRLVVERAGSRATADDRRVPTVDTIDCVAHRSNVRRSADRWPLDAMLEVNGALRRRFWRGPHGAASRYEVEVIQARKL
jgi:single-strand DNA-binding protein